MGVDLFVWLGMIKKGWIHLLEVKIRGVAKGYTDIPICFKEICGHEMVCKLRGILITQT